MNWKTIRHNLAHLPSTMCGIAMLLASLPQLEAVQTVMAMSPKIANLITTVACVAGGISAIILMGQKLDVIPDKEDIVHGDEEKK